ncbi:sigma-54-dependent Fis family transcriptional regulator [Paludibaculum fermentans]|uniref:Sigma 54-interacting transcriptional regulator n=1 Tax=Paludibaculum fermentans TaxID=1473598 RepID=A0A7S7NLN9_PALFE|nr:sigma 54-interacting transcriptional regulator [Paludibaculum fermentans]QOY85895.1 sigma 54-interacting transcriptional regulator [Paludibaculum fermentans]
MELELLQSISLAVSQVRTVETVLKMIVSGLVDTAGVALARIWLIGPGDICPTCRMSSECADRHTCLHLAASAGRSRMDGSDWSSLDGAFRRFPLQVRKIGWIASSGQSMLIEDAVSDTRWTLHPGWVRNENIHGFAGHPLVYGGEILGVLGVFARVHITEQQFKLLRVFADQAAVSIANARAFEEIQTLQLRAERENDYLKTEVKENLGGFRGQSPALQRLLSQIGQVAPTDASVLILGESGTGKELVARAIHDNSRRANRVLVKANCASIPRELFESEFFGHVKGAFTGAMRDRLGRFELADGGTLFLDEIAEIPLELQSKLLRVLQEGEFERVGEERTRPVDVRVIAATNRDLRSEMAAGRFRADLYFRLSVFPIQTPPLRDRLEDVVILAADFLEKASKRLNLSIPRLTADNIRDLCNYDWPGNVRELQNVLERALIVSGGRQLRFDLRNSAPPPSPAAQPVGRLHTRGQLLELERSQIVEALERCKGKIYGSDGAAALLGLRPTTLSSKIAALKIRRPRP